MDYTVLDEYGNAVGSVGGSDAAGSTVAPNPTVYSYGETSVADQLSQAAGVLGQWGATIASVVTGNPVQSVVTPQGVQTIGARGSAISPSIFAGNSGILLLLIAGVVVILLVRK